STLFRDNVSQNTAKPPHIRLKGIRKRSWLRRQSPRRGAPAHKSRSPAASSDWIESPVSFPKGRLTSSPSDSLSTHLSDLTQPCPNKVKKESGLKGRSSATPNGPVTREVCHKNGHRWPLL